MASTTIYLDYAAATPLDPRVRRAMEPYLSSKFFNPSAAYLAAKDVQKDLESARALVAHHLGAKSQEIIFIAGASEANNLAIHGLMKKYPKGNIVVSAIEHESVLEPAKLYKYKIAKVKPDGQIDLEHLDKLIDNNTVLVSIMQANNEIGTVQPLKDIAKLISQKRSSRTNKLPLYFHTDSAQAANYLDLHVDRLGVDLMSLNGAKIYGPKQTGALYVKAGINLEPLILGGGQERGLRSGTENIAGCIGLSQALDITQNLRHSESKRLHDLQSLFLNSLKTKLPKVLINGSEFYRLPNNIHLTIPGIDNERLLYQLDKHGVQVATGSACSASSNEPSHVLKAIGLSDEAARSSLRLSLGRQTTKEQIDTCVKLLAKL